MIRQQSAYYFAAFAMLAFACPADAQAATFIDKHHPNDLRVVSYNIYFDSIFRDVLRQRFVRVVNALNPDILNLQEISSSAAEVASLMNTFAPLPGSATWYTHKFSDNVIVSKHPFINTGRLSRGAATALVDVPGDVYPNDLFVVNDHWPCCTNESGRQSEADRMVAELQDLRTPGGRFEVSENTPFLVLGDLNIVGSGRPLETILHGDILDEERFGPDSPPDWDGTSLADARPLHNAVGPDDYTWREDLSPFDPGILDFILYTDSLLETANEFVLNPSIMSPAELTATGLEPGDVAINPDTGFFDHLPVVADFRFVVPEPSSIILLGLAGSVLTRPIAVSNSKR